MKKLLVVIILLISIFSFAHENHEEFLVSATCGDRSGWNGQMAFNVALNGYMGSIKIANQQLCNETIKKVRQNTQYPFLVCGCHDRSSWDGNTKLSCLKIDETGFISKPFSNVELTSFSDCTKEAAYLVNKVNDTNSLKDK